MGLSTLDTAAVSKFRVKKNERKPAWPAVRDLMMHCAFLRRRTSRLLAASLQRGQQLQIQVRAVAASSSDPLNVHVGYQGLIVVMPNKQTFLPVDRCLQIVPIAAIHD